MRSKCRKSSGLIELFISIVKPKIEFTIFTLNELSLVFRGAIKEKAYQTDLLPAWESTRILRGLHSIAIDLFHETHFKLSLDVLGRHTLRQLWKWSWHQGTVHQTQKERANGRSNPEPASLVLHHLLRTCFCFVFIFSRIHFPLYFSIFPFCSFSVWRWEHKWVWFGYFLFHTIIIIFININMISFFRFFTIVLCLAGRSAIGAHI